MLNDFGPWLRISYLRSSERRLQSTELQGLYASEQFDRKNLEGTALIFSLEAWPHRIRQAEVPELL